MFKTSIMKLILKLFITLTLLFEVFNIQAQPQSITLTFTSRTDTYGEYTALDSVLIINRNRNCDTTLYAPDTSFVLYYTVGIQNRVSQTAKPLLSNFYPNPANNGKTGFNLNTNRNGTIYLKLVDLQGNVLLQKQVFLWAGESKFGLTLSKPGLFLLSAYNNSVLNTIKILNKDASGKPNAISLLTHRKEFKNTESSKGNPWWFEPGDTLWYVGYAKTPQEINGSDVMEDVPSADTLITLRILEGIPCSGTEAVKYGGHLYPTVQIKERCWLKENLNAGVIIPSDSAMSDNGITEKYCYDNKETNCNDYGGLYQWDEMMQYTTQESTQGICPVGWHVPSLEEWNYLTYGYTGNDFKEKGNIHWQTGSNGNNSTGFTALPAGGWDSYSKEFVLLTKDAPFFTSTKFPPPYIWVYFKEFNMSSIIVAGNAHSTDALAVRCIKDQ